MEKMSKAVRVECVLRMLSVVFTLMAALLVGLDTQTKTVFFIRKVATFRDLDALWVMIIVIGIACGYHLLQLVTLIAMAWLGKNPCNHPNKLVAWVNLFLDQGLCYATFASIMASLQGATIAIFGISNFQWSKLCNVYTRFCEQLAVGALVTMVAFVIMGVIPIISAYRLFRFQSQHCSSLSKATTTTTTTTTTTQCSSSLF